MNFFCIIFFFFSFTYSFVALVLKTLISFLESYLWLDNAETSLLRVNQSCSRKSDRCFSSGILSNESHYEKIRKNIHLKRNAEQNNGSMRGKLKMTYVFSFNSFSTIVPLTQKPGSWFLLAKYLKNICLWKSDILSKDAGR